MTRRAVRLSLFLVLAAIVIASGYWIARLERASWDATTAARAFDATAQRAAWAIVEGRTGQLAYAAPGQDPAWWQPRVAAAIEQARKELAALRERGTDPATLNDLDAAAAALDAMGDTDARARKLVRVDQPSQAVATVLGAGLEAANTALQRIESGRTTEQLALDRRVGDVRRSQATAAAGAALGALLVGGLLVARGADRAAARRGPAAPMDAGSPAADRPAPSAERVATPAAPAAPPPASDPAPAALPIEQTGGVSDPGQYPHRDRRKAPELRAAADLCTDFSRLLDPREMPGLLDRAAKLIDAAGLIVWIADPRTSTLRATLAHGYSAQDLARFPEIPRQADNATAAAFRLVELQVVKTNGMSPGAIVVPLLSASGCVGVMAAEVRHGREASESARALARIIAAQLSTLLAVPAAGQQASPAAAEHVVG